MPTASSPPSPIGRALQACIDDVYAGNKKRFAMALGVSRATLYEWLGNPRPRIEEALHRQSIADVLWIDLRQVDTLIVLGLGYRVSPVRPEGIVLGVLLAGLDDEDVAMLERQVLRLLRRDAAIRGATPLPASEHL